MYSLGIFGLTLLALGLGFFLGLLRGAKVYSDVLSEREAKAAALRMERRSSGRVVRLRRITFGR